MSLEKEISSLEQKNDWKSAIQLLDRFELDEPEIYLRVIFLLLDLLVEGQYTQEEHDYAAKKLRYFFDKSNEKFSEDAEFLFFSGIMVYLAEWYFGMDSVEPAAAMLKKAMRMRPDQCVFKWGYYSSIDQRLEKNTELKLQLSKQLLFKEPATLDWLKSKGLLGKYILGTLEGTYEGLKAM